MSKGTERPFIPIPESDTTTALIRATERSFGIIVPLSTATSKNKEVQVILREIHKGGGNYVASVSKSFKTAESGFAFAKRAQDLCNALGRRDCSDEVIHDSITEMRAIAQKAHDDAKATTKMFDANKQEFTEIRHHTSETFKAIDTKRMEVIASRNKAKSKEASSWAVAKIYYKQRADAHGKKAISCEEALQNLVPAEKDLELLKVEMDIVAEYWIGVDTELRDIETRVKALRDDDMLQMRIRTLSRDWKGVAQDHKCYISALNTLLNNNPQYKEFVASRPAITARAI